jgi:hypothetical protein
MNEYRCKNIKPEVILERLGFSFSDVGWTRKTEGFYGRYHCQVEGKLITQIHRDKSVISKGIRLTRHKAVEAPEMYYAISFMDDRHIARTSDELIKRIMPGPIIKLGKMARKMSDKLTRKR